MSIRARRRWISGVLLALLCVGHAARAATAPSTLSWRDAGVASRDEVTAIAVSTDGARVAVGDARGLLLGDVGGNLSRALHRGPVRDVVFFDGVVLVATDGGLWRLEADGRAALASLAPGAGGARRIAALPDLLLVASEGGVFVSRDARSWQRLSPNLPNGDATAVAVRSRAGGFRCWSVVGGRLWRTALDLRNGRLVAAGSVRETLPSSAAFGPPADVDTSAPEVDVVVVYPRALAARRAPDASWEVWRPALPPGASALRVARHFGRLWLATDRGLLEAEHIGGPWHRAAAPAGSRAVRDLAGRRDALFVATPAGLLVGRREAPSAARAPRAVSWGENEPSIDAVRRVALRYLDLGPKRIEGLHRGLARRGWLPIASLRVARDESTSWTRERDEAFLTGEVRRTVDRDRDRDRDLEVSVSFSWDFGDIAYNPESIDVSREAREIIELRDDVLDEVNQLYFERRRALAELAATPPDDAASALRLRLRAAELAAGIDAWTGGWFSAQLGASSP